uniref:Reverse transcriptase zinc-binding domain-containing protein n=1 Tax=Cannabis sativa TaxID=3483 RepID=A0A803PM74_CANSA
MAEQKLAECWMHQVSQGSMLPLDILVFPYALRKSRTNNGLSLERAIHDEGASLLAWNNVCHLRSEGGSGIKKIVEWNSTALFKYVWAIANKEDNLWVKWIHNVYLKEKDWWEYQAPSHESRYWKQIAAAKNQVRSLTDAQQFSQNKYRISDGYDLICPIQNSVYWCNEVWGRFNIPKHSFILWLAIQNRLKTKDRLQRFQIVNDATCNLCL